ncbi:MAG: nuclear transport factor 2 family protein [Solirubrobacterales bacterium]
MSQENLEIVQAIYAETAEGRFGTSLHLFHPDVEYSRSASGEGGTAVDMSTTARGLEAMVMATFDWIQTFDRLRVQAERFIEAGDSIVVFVRHTGNAKASGLPIEAEFADVMTLREGRVIRFDQYRDRAEALKAAGLSE